MKMVFSKTQYRKQEGERNYIKNQKWVDKYNNKEVVDGKIVGTKFRVQPEWCVERKKRTIKPKQKPVAETIAVPTPEEIIKDLTHIAESIQEEKAADELNLDMSKAEVVKVDHEEYHKQTKESILKSGHYCSLELIVPEKDNEDSTIANIDFHNVSSLTVAAFIADLKHVLKDIAEKHPMEAMMSELIGTKTSIMGETERDTEDEEE